MLHTIIVYCYIFNFVLILVYIYNKKINNISLMKNTIIQVDIKFHLAAGFSFLGLLN